MARRGTLKVYDRLNATWLADISTTDLQGRQRDVDELAQVGDPIHAMGSGTFVLQEDHPAVVGGHIQKKNVIRIHSGDDRVVAVRIKRIVWAKRRRLQSHRTITVHVVGLLRDWELAIIAPWRWNRPLTQSRVWNWASPNLDLTGTQTRQWEQVRTAVPQRPAGFPVAPDYSGWVWTRADSASQPVGSSLFWRDFTLAQDEMLNFSIAADSEFELWVDGVQIEQRPVFAPDQSGWQHTWQYIFPVHAGDHRMAVKVTNWGGRAALLAGVFKMQANGMFGDALFATSFQNPSGWRSMDYPDPLPGFTAPEILQQIIDESAANSLLHEWTLTIHGTHSELEEFSVRVGSNCFLALEALIELAVDVRVDTVGLNLHVYPKGYSYPTAVELLDDSVITLDVDEDDELTNGVMAAWQDGFVIYQDGVSAAAHTSHAKTLELGQVHGPVVDEIMHAYVEAHKNPVKTVLAELIDRPNKVAGVDFKTGDFVEVDGVRQRVVGLTWSFKRNGDIVAHPEFNDPLLVARDERLRAIDRMTERFDSGLTAPLLDSNPQIVRGKVQIHEHRWTWTDNILDQLDVDDPTEGWQPHQWEKPRRLCFLRIEIKEEDLPDAHGETRVSLMIDGTPINPLYWASLTESRWKHEIPIWAYEQFNAGQQLTVYVVPDLSGDPVEGGHVDGTITVGMAEMN